MFDQKNSESLLGTELERADNDVEIIDLTDDDVDEDAMDDDSWHHDQDKMESTVAETPTTTEKFASTKSGRRWSKRLTPRMPRVLRRSSGGYNQFDKQPSNNNSNSSSNNNNNNIVKSLRSSMQSPRKQTKKNALTNHLQHDSDNSDDDTKNSELGDKREGDADDDNVVSVLAATPVQAARKLNFGAKDPNSTPSPSTNEFKTPSSTSPIDYSIDMQRQKQRDIETEMSSLSIESPHQPRNRRRTSSTKKIKKRSEDEIPINFLKKTKRRSLFSKKDKNLDDGSSDNEGYDFGRDARLSPANVDLVPILGSLNIRDDSHGGPSSHFQMLQREAIKTCSPRPIFESYLTKQGKFRKNWKRRWCIIDESGTIRYYKPKKYTPSGVIDLVDDDDEDYLALGVFATATCAGSRPPVVHDPLMKDEELDQAISWPSGIPNRKCRFAVKGSKASGRTFFFYADDETQADKWKQLIATLVAKRGSSESSPRLE